jgi:hypothetical protein
MVLLRFFMGSNICELCPILFFFNGDFAKFLVFRGFGGFLKLGD